jgi:hypothetical protein
MFIPPCRRRKKSTLRVSNYNSTCSGPGRRQEGCINVNWPNVLAVVSTCPAPLALSPPWFPDRWALGPWRRYGTVYKSKNSHKWNEKWVHVNDRDLATAAPGLHLVLPCRRAFRPDKKTRLHILWELPPFVSIYTCRRSKKQVDCAVPFPADRCAMLQLVPSRSPDVPYYS